MKKKIIIIVVILLSVVLVGLVIAYVTGVFYQPSKQEIRYMNELNSANSVIYYYGNLDPGKEITIEYQKVTEFTEDTIGDTKGEYDYHAIVIFDFDNTMDLSDEELKLAKDYCENRYYDLIYYGTKHMDSFRNCGYFQQIGSDNLGFTYNGSYWLNRTKAEEYVNPYLLLGNWSESDEEWFSNSDKHMMWKFVISYVEGLIKDSMEQS
jgi:hypothetical protein